MDGFTPSHFRFLEKRCGYRVNIADTMASTSSTMFNASMVGAMFLKLTNYFLLIPALPLMQAHFGVTAGEIAQLATVYEGGKLLGSLLFGALSDRVNKLRMVLWAMVGYCACVGVLLFLVYDQSAVDAVLGSSRARFVLFAGVYFVASLASIASQTGLSILRFVNDKPAYRKVIVAQSVAGAFMQGSWLVVGALAVELLGWRSAFVVMAAVAALSSVGLRLASSQATFDACEPVPVGDDKPASPLLGQRGDHAEAAAADSVAVTMAPAAAAAGTAASGGSAALDAGPKPTAAEQDAAAAVTHASKLTRAHAAAPDRSFASRLRVLFSVEQARFQAFILALGVATATMYTWPTFATLLLVRDLGMDHDTATWWIVGPFALNALLRLSSSFLLKKIVSSEVFVWVGMAFLVLGSSTWLTWTFLQPELTIAQVIVPGYIQMAGVSLTMPHCKAGAMLDVPDHVSGAAVSMLKLSQLVVAGIVAFVAASLFERTALPVAATLFGASALGAIMFFCALSRGTPAAAEPAAKEDASAAQPSVDASAATKSRRPTPYFVDKFGADWLSRSSQSRSFAGLATTSGSESLLSRGGSEIALIPRGASLMPLPLPPAAERAAAQVQSGSAAIALEGSRTTR